MHCLVVLLKKQQFYFKSNWSTKFQGFLKNETRNFDSAKRENIEVTTNVLRQANSVLTENNNNNIHVVNNDYEKDLIASDTETEITELEVEFDDSVDDLTSSTELSTSDPMADSIKQSSRLKARFFIICKESFFQYGFDND